MSCNGPCPAPYPAGATDAEKDCMDQAYLAYLADHAACIISGA